MNIGPSCEKCPLAAQRGLVIKDDSPEQCDIVFVSDGPSSSDIFEGRLLTGPQGTLFSKVLEYKGIKRENVYVTNACLCRLDPKNYKKGYQKDELSRCRERLYKEIKAKNPKIVVAMGNTAVQAVLNRKEGVTALRGTPIFSHELDLWVTATFNPGALMKSPKYFADFQEDIGKISTQMYGDANALKKELETKTWLISNVKDALKVIAFLKEQKKVSCDIETQGFNFRKHKIYCVAFTWEKGSAVVFKGELLDDPVVRIQLGTLMESPNVKFVWQGGKFDVKFFRSQLAIQAKVDIDIMLKHYAIDERRGTHDLETLSQTLLGAADYKTAFWKKWKPHIANLPPEALKDLYEYCGSDSDYSFRIDNILDPLLESNGAKRAYHELLIPGSDTFADIESHGFYIDQANLQAAEDKYEMIVNGLREELRLVAYEVGWDPDHYQELSGVKKAPEDFNQNSWRHLGYILFDLLKLPIHKGKRSTDEEALDHIQYKVLGKPKEKYFEELYKPKDTDDEATAKALKAQGKAEFKAAVDRWLEKHGNPAKFIHSLLQYRENFKLYGTYIRGVRNAMHEDDGRVHATFKLHGTETGRLSSADPNMQNIPRLPEIRNLFTVPEGYKLLQADYSQAELRVLAVLSQDPFLMKVYYDGGDLHDAVALKLFGPNFTKEQRVRAKAVNFG